MRRWNSSVIRGMAATAGIVCAIFLTLIGPERVNAGARYREFREDSRRLQDMLERSGAVMDTAGWERAAGMARESLAVEWERDAEVRMQAELRRNGDDAARREELDAARDAARADWETAADRAIEEAEGRWLARRYGVSLPSWNRKALTDAVEHASENPDGKEGNERVSAFDDVIASAMSEVSAEWEESLGTMLESVRLKSAELDAGGRASCEREVVKIEHEFRESFRLETRSLLYRDRNMLVRDTLVDQASLRYLSEQGSADAACARVLAGTRSGLAKDRESIMERDTSRKDDPAVLNFSSMGSNWQEEIRSLLKKGNERWRKAQDDFLSTMRTWKENADEAYAEGERRWQAALARLVRERDEWRTDMSNQIQAGIASWQKQQDDLQKNISDAREQYAEYLASEKELWNVFSSEMYRVLVEGRRTIADAGANAAWLHGKSQEYSTQGYFSGSFRNNATDPQELVKYGYLEQMLGDAVANAVTAAKQMYPAGNWRVKVDEDCIINKWGAKVGCHNVYDYYTQVVYDNPVVTITNALSRAEYDSSTGNVNEQYSVTISVYAGYVHNDTTGVVTQLNYYTTTLPMNYLMTSATEPDRRSRYYYYINEDTNWSATLQNSADIVRTLETAFQENTISGLNGGPGYLSNSDGAYGLKYSPDGGLDSDPYLMTGVEMGYEYSRREEEYWRGRLAIAEDVLKYARPDLYPVNEYASGGMREDAAVTRERVDHARTAMEALRDEYQASLAGVDALVEAMTSKKAELESLSRGLAAKKQLADDLAIPYGIAKQAVVEAEDAGGAPAGLLADLKAKGDACGAAEKDYADLTNSITTAKREYEAIQKSYSDRINDNAARYHAFQEAEFAYERAYAVWEYANTPYLNDTSAGTLSIGSGVLADGTLADFDSFSAPDALDNYQAVLAMYESKKSDFDACSSILAGQEKVEDLANDSAYGEYKTGLRDATMQLIDALSEGADELALETLMEVRAAALNAFRVYAAQAVEDGAHDRTILLRDEEALYRDMLAYAKNSGSDDGYAIVAGELISDGRGTSVDDRIVAGLMQQSLVFQEQLWEQQISTFTEKKNRWMEVTGFIANRGEHGWSGMMSSVLNQWRLWRVEAKEEIDRGEREWTASAHDLGGRIQSWNKRPANDACREGAKKLADEIGSSMNRHLALFTARINEKIGASLDLSIDTDGIVQSMMKTMNADMGILNTSMYAMNSTTGFTELLTLGLSGNGFDMYQRESAKLQKRIATMQSVKLGEMAYAGFMEMLSRFNSRIAAMNADVYNRINTEMNEADPYAEADFERRNGYWEIRYVSDYSLAGGANHRYYAFQDYEYFENKAVFIKPLTGEHGKIDFANAYSYEHLSADEVNRYVIMEQEHLTREISNIFDEGGAFEQHANSEFTRLGNAFGEGYQRWAEGEAMTSAGWYRTPVVPGGPDPITLTRVGGGIALSVTCGPWAAFALNAALTGVDVADGTTSWKHAGVQMGAGAASALTGGMGGQLINVAASGLEYEEGGGIGWSNSNFRQGVVRGAITMAVSPVLNGALGNGTVGTGLSAGLTTFAASSVQVGEGWSGMYQLGWDEDNWEQHVTEGAASGVTSGLMKGINRGEDAQGNALTGASSQSFPNIYGDAFANKAISGGIHGMMMTAGYHAFAGEGFENNYSKFNYGSMAYNAYDLGGFLGNRTHEWVIKNAAKPEAAGKGERGWGREVMDAAARALHVSESAERAMEDYLRGVGENAAGEIKDFGQNAWKGIADAYDEVKERWNRLAEQEVNKVEAFQRMKELQPPEEYRQKSRGTPLIGERENLIITNPYPDYINRDGSLGKSHSGLDIGAKKGEEVKSIRGGTITCIKKDGRAGVPGPNYVEITTEDGYREQYKHVYGDKDIVEGQEVNPGESLGVVDMSGRTSGPHCHFEVMEKKKGGWRNIDPLEYIYRNTSQSVILNQSVFPVDKYYKFRYREKYNRVVNRNNYNNELWKEIKSKGGRDYERNNVH